MRINTLRARCVLLDIEGTVSDVRFVYDVMFPYAKREIEPYLATHWGSPSVVDVAANVAKDAQIDDIESWLGTDWKTNPHTALPTLVAHLNDLMSRDSKTTGLKQLQGLVWQTGFESGALRAELFDDVLPALRNWRDAGLDIRIYSSGSILAQKMFFKHTVVGDLTSFFSAHFDTTSGSKKDSSSYERIARESHFDASDILFATDVYAELIAASQAGMQVVASVRPNNVPLPTEFIGLAITSFEQLDISLPD